MLANLKPEYVSLALNVGILARYIWLWQEPGKILYWLGATILTVGLLLLKG